jgi:hypothetical protein
VSTTLLRSNTARVRCPLIRITTDSGMPTLRARVMKLRRRSWNQRLWSPAAATARRNGGVRAREGAQGEPADDVQHAEARWVERSPGADRLTRGRGPADRRRRTMTDEELSIRPTSAGDEAILRLSSPRAHSFRMISRRRARNTFWSSRAGIKAACRGPSRRWPRRPCARAPWPGPCCVSARPAP